MNDKSRINRIVDLSLMTETTQLSKENRNGDAGYRSPYLTHAKRALYHLSYIPALIIATYTFEGQKEANKKPDTKPQTNSHT
ncbi:hypothetical protein HN51_043760 [Arachis hypogaea]